MRGGRVVVILLGLLGLWHTCEAADFTCPAGDVSCLINAINTANMNGQENTITLAAGTYTLADVDNITDEPNGLPTITSALIITGAGAAATTIERLRLTAFFRLMHVAATGRLTLQELTVQGFVVSSTAESGGGGIRNDGTLTIINSTLNGNIASVLRLAGSGGGIRNAGTLTITNSTLSNNVARFGGGIFNEGTVTITNSVLSGNRGGFMGVSGGIYNSAGGTVVLSQSTLSGNVGGFAGGGVFNDGTATIVDSTFVSNTGGDAGALGGGIANFGTLTIMKSTFRGNRVGFNGGGGIVNVAPGTVRITNTAISDNLTGGNGAGIMNLGGTMTITNSTLSGNTAGLAGGGIFNGSGFFNPGTVTITNSTISGNAVSVIGIGGGIVNSDVGSSVVTIQNTILALNVSRRFAPDCSAVTSLGHNLIGTTTHCDIALQPSDLIGDPGLDTFIDDGTPGNGHYPLLPTSQAIDAGDKKVCPKTDQIGQKRRHPCDIGAIEFPDHP